MLRPLLLVLLVVFHHPELSSSGLVGTKIHFFYDSPITITVYRVAQGSVSGIQKAFADHNHDTIAKGEEFTVLVDFSSPFYNKERQWYEIPARFCYGKDIQKCVNQTRPFSHPYLVRPSSLQTPVPFVIPFSRIHKASLPDGSTVNEAGTVHKRFKTFQVNGAKYDTSTGILERFLPESPEKAGKISGIDFSRDTGRVLKHQPLVQCYFVEWSTDGCAPGLNHLVVGYDAKSLELKRRPWLNVKFSEHRIKSYLQTIRIPRKGTLTYLVPKDMILKEESKMATPFAYVFESVHEQVKEVLKSVGLDGGMGTFEGSARYESYTKHYEQRASSAAMSGVVYRFFHTSMSTPYLQDKANWDNAFKTRWKGLLDQRNKGKALDLFREYGTHYVVEAVMGGRQEKVYTVDYCKVTKDEETEKEFEANLMIPYGPGGHVGVQKTGDKSKSDRWKNMIKSGPQTTCTGGNSLDLDVCYNLTLWKQSLFDNPHPVKMTVRPFYTLVEGDEDSGDRKWMKEMYEEYLKANLDEMKIKKDIKVKASCTPPKGAKGISSRGCLPSGALPVVAVIAGIILLELWL